MAAMNPGARFEVAQDVHVRAFHDELVLLDLGRGEYFSLDAVGAKIWDGLRNGRSVGEVVTGVAASYDTDVAQVEADVKRLVDELVARQLLVPLNGDAVK